MITELPLLQNVRVASPCNASWDDMAAIDGDRVKFCGGCKKNVYNLSAMSQGEAEGLLRKHEGRLCIRYYQRNDGTILSGDCSVGAQTVRMAMIRRSVAAAGLFAMMFGAMAAVNSHERQPLPVPELTEAPATWSGPVDVPKRDNVMIIPRIAPEPEMRPMMGAMVPLQQVEPPVPVRRHKMAMLGKMAMPPQDDAHEDHVYVAPSQKLLDEGIRNQNIPDIPVEKQSTTPEKDSTDEAILKPHEADLNVK